MIFGSQFGPDAVCAIAARCSAQRANSTNHAIVAIEAESGMDKSPQDRPTMLTKPTPRDTLCPEQSLPKRGSRAFECFENGSPQNSQYA